MSKMEINGVVWRTDADNRWRRDQAPSSTGGILVAEGADGAYQIIAAASTRDEAVELARNYIAVGAGEDCLAPERFVVHRPGRNGWYNRIEELTEVM